MSKPKDSMKSTWWRTGDKTNWALPHHLIDLVNGYPIDINSPIPVHPKTAPVPRMSELSQASWILLYALAPMLLHQAWLSLTGYPRMGRLAVFLLYFTAYNVTTIKEVHVLRRLGHKLGFLDGDAHERDGVPDVGVGRVAGGFYRTTGSRMALAALLTYDPSASRAPADALADPAWWAWTALEVGLYALALDFWFYLYHRAMHDVSFLWRFHRTHHLTKHPNPLLSAYADHEQEFFDMVVVPLLAGATLRAAGCPMGFYDWWVSHQFVAFTEVFGHSGLRVYGTPVSSITWLLRATGTELAVEDHDMHHRYGYRSSHNYGKQTRVWDRLFGTCGERPETSNVSDEVVYVPLF